MKKLTISSELAYILSLSLIALSVAMASAADFGVSMIAAPTYILSLKFSFFTFGQWEYCIQAALFVAMCLLLGKFKPIYLMSFLSSVIYGTILDIWRIIIPMLNPAITAPGSMDMLSRLVLFVVAEILIGIALPLILSSYLLPQVYDFFTKAVAEHFKIDFVKFKRYYDYTFLVVAVALSLILFRGFVGIGLGTIVITLVNAPVIGFFKKLSDKYLEYKPTFKALVKFFE